MFSVTLAFHSGLIRQQYCVLASGPSKGLLVCLFFLPLRIVLIEWLCCFNLVCHSKANPHRECVLWSLACLLRTQSESQGPSSVRAWNQFG